jgi:2-haloacid dehalogenase
MQDSPTHLTTVVFDLGAVVLRWEPERAFQHVLPAEQVPDFMAEIDFFRWNRSHDAGQPFEVGEAELIERFPDRAAAIRAYRQHFVHTLTGMVEGTGAIIAELQQAGIRLIGLTNWSAETFPEARKRFAILDRFEDIVVSGSERLAKPDPALFALVSERFSLDPEGCVFVDDSAVNVAAAAQLGMTAVQFSDAVQLRSRLVELGLLGERREVKAAVFHVTERAHWNAALNDGDFPWSSRGLTYQQQGFVHCSFSDQVQGVIENIYLDVPSRDLVILELDPRLLDVPVIVEEVAPGTAYPHLFGPLPLASVTEVYELDEWLEGDLAGGYTVDPAGPRTIDRGATGRPSPL